ncbi:hypothetical protein Fot_51734 [Forsythia ovata]|uniref:Uncharacterized protein n=1 Tax=Forsythia ovata TaxID=205694 RepID=A0ABD1PX56_9LAMI
MQNPFQNPQKGLCFTNFPNHPASENPSSRTFLNIRADVSYESNTTIESPGKKSPVSTADDDDPLHNFLKRDCKWGFSEEIESFTIPKGLSEETVRLISSRKKEPDWMLEFRLKSYEKFANVKEPKWSDNQVFPKKFVNMRFLI